MDPDESSDAPDLLARIIAPLERISKTDLTYLIGNGFWLGIAQVGIAGIAFVLSISFAHFVSKDTYGTYRFLLSVFWTLTAFSLTGLPTALARAVARGEEQAYGDAFKLSLIWSWPMILISLGLSGYYYHQGNNLLAMGALIIAVVGPFMQATYLYGSYLEGKRAFQFNAIAGIILNFFPALLLFGSMFLTKNPLVYLAMYLIGNSGTAALISLYIYFHYKPYKSKKTKKLLTLGSHFSAMNILSTVSSQIDRLLVYHYLGAVNLAIYTFSTAMPDQVKGVINNVTTLAFPKFASRDIKEIQATLQYRLLGFSVLMLVVTTVYILFAPLAFHILFPAYAASIGYSQLYALGLIPIGAAIPVTVMQAHVENKKLYIYNIVSSVFQIGILFPAIMYYGLIGIVVARILSRVFNLVLVEILIFVRTKKVRT